MLPQRKTMRLKEFDYNSFGYYFITFCTKDKKCILGKIPENNEIGVPQVLLSEYGVITEKHISKIGQNGNFEIDKYVIMPNHVHLILIIGGENIECNMRSISSGVPRASRPTNIVSNTVGYLKRLVNKDIGHQIWQSSFYDHIIRNEQDYLRIWEYIDTNPLKWANDEYYNRI